MSAGSFESAFYEMSEENGGFVLRCRVQPETLAATVASTANAGVNMRYVTLGFTGAPPAGYSGDPVRIPVLDPAVFAEWTLGAPELTWV